MTSRKCKPLTSAVIHFNLGYWRPECLGCSNILLRTSASHNNIVLTVLSTMGRECRYTHVASVQTICVLPKATALNKRVVRHLQITLWLCYGYNALIRALRACRFQQMPHSSYIHEAIHKVRSAWRTDRTDRKDRISTDRTDWYTTLVYTSVKVFPSFTNTYNASPSAPQNKLVFRSIEGIEHNML